MKHNTSQSNGGKKGEKPKIPSEIHNPEKWCCQTTSKIKEGTAKSTRINQISKN